MTKRKATRPTNTSPPTTLDTTITTVLSESLLVSPSPPVFIVGGTVDTAVVMVGPITLGVVVFASVVVGTAVTVVGRACVNVLDAGTIGVADVVVGGGVVDGESVKGQQSMYTTRENNI